MEKKYCWGLKVDGELYRVRCQVTDEEFQVYVNQELQWTVDRDPVDPMDEDLELGSLVYRLTEEDDRIILSRNGMAMMNMAETRQKRAKPAFKSANFQAVAGATCAAVGLYRVLNGYTLGEVSMLLTVGAVFVGLGLYQRHSLKVQLETAEEIENETY